VSILGWDRDTPVVSQWNVGPGGTLLAQP
jgi:hypothetical protein